ncbi:septum formation initiator family protein [Fastidiosibacter lacustris]|uniref:septum formation initiator family protein n=1 Tax=Fastidiosibacter lacustris TaxID=2056695 RepID=UPI000E34AD90|nr:septum formation initiator family protein [Fastidiosibacter lacustris]
MITRYTFFIAVLVTGIGALQYDFWWSQTGFFATQKLNQEVNIKQMENNKLQARNNQLYAEILSLRHNDFILEGMARQNLGFIKDGEMFYQIFQPQEKVISLQEDKK